MKLPILYITTDGSFLLFEERRKLIREFDEKRLQFLIAWVEDTLDFRIDNEEENTMVSAILEVLSIHAEQSPVSFEKFAQKTQLKTQLIEVIYHHTHPVGLVSAIRLLSFFGGIEEKTITAIFWAIENLGISTINEAKKTLLSLHTDSRRIVDYLFSQLEENDNPNVLYLCIQALTNIGKNERTDPMVRKQILKKLQNLIPLIKFKQCVFELVGYGTESSPYQSKYKDQLDKVIVAAIYEITGIQ